MKFRESDKVDIVVCLFIMLICLGINSGIYDEMNYRLADYSTEIEYNTEVYETTYSRSGTYIHFKNAENCDAATEINTDYNNDEYNDIRADIIENNGRFGAKYYIVKNLYLDGEVYKK